MEQDLRGAQAAARERGSQLQAALAREAHLEQQVTALTGDETAASSRLASLLTKQLRCLLCVAVYSCDPDCKKVSCSKLTTSATPLEVHATIVQCESQWAAMSASASQRRSIAHCKNVDACNVLIDCN